MEPFSKQLPPGGVMHVSIIDSTADLVGAAGCSVTPEIPGQAYLNFKTFVFLLEHSQTGTRILFDGGLRLDWWNLAPDIAQFIESDMPGLRVTRSINQILRDGGVDDESIDAVIWSHHHYDHIGDASLFPPSTKILVGPGFTEEFMPGYPTRQDAELLDTDFAGRVVQELDFKQSSTIVGTFRALDYFEDGSLYILDTPGHDIGHLSALVRTTPDTFVLLGGDICDAPQAWRPTSLNPLPEQFPNSSNSVDPRIGTSNPCTVFAPCHRVHDRDAARTTPFSLLSNSAESFYDDPVTAQHSVEALKIFDAAPDVLVAVAHDTSLRAILRFFPDGTINDWKARGWKEMAMWGFLRDLPVDGKIGTPMLVDGLYRGGVKVRSAQEVLTPTDRGSQTRSDM